MCVRVAILAFVVSSSLLAQAVAETAAGAARAASTAIPAQKINKSTTAAFDKINRSVQNSVNSKSKPSAASASPAKPPAPAATRAVRPETPPAPKPAVSFEDPSGIREGIDYEELIMRFGEPSLRLTTSSSQETLCYAKDDLQVDVIVRSGRVTAVQKRP